MAAYALAPRKAHLRSPLMAPDAMIEFLARVAKQMREKDGRKPYHIAAELDKDPSTVWRFEQGRWPQDVDAMIAAYARDLERDPLEIWTAALDLWRKERASAPEPAVALEAEVLRVRDRQARTGGASRRKPAKRKGT